MGSITTIDRSSKREVSTNNVAIIGAGISGITSAAHLKREGLNATVFERTQKIGGAWVYERQLDRDPPFPNTLPPVYDWGDIDEPGLTVEEASLILAPPGPCYAGLKNNVPTSLMKSSLLKWPDGTEEFVDQGRIVDYVAEIANSQDVTRNIKFCTRVENVYKPEGSLKWKVRYCTLTAKRQTYSITRQEEEFDAVVVASGHYHVPFVPDVPGLSEWKKLFPDRVLHSKRYRTADAFRDKTVLLIGAGASSLDIAREVIEVGGQVYQSRRESKYDLIASRLPKEVDRVAMVTHFIAAQPESSRPESLSGKAIPGKVVLDDGTTLEGIDYVIVATGYITSYPFLGDLEQPLVDWNDAGERTVITSDGYTTHNLHKDIFYIPDPTLAFIGVSQLVSTFSLFDFQAKIVAKVLAGKARLPTQDDMKKEQRERKKRFQPGDRFHALLLGETAYINELLTWANEQLVDGGFDPMTGMDADWLKAYDFYKGTRTSETAEQAAEEADGIAE
ncbi:hypothetical protein GGR57DRAFT_495121 [Xylariaceae sp. FL1272]|nr:hypothetical protein GGR57DRAFT_495121 [Xylariaceae sp. FL1272]